MRRAYLIFAVICVLCLLCSGCAMTYFRDANGVRFLRITFGTDQQIGPVDLVDGKTRLKVGGVKSEQSDAAGKVAGAAVEALKPKLLP